MENVMTDFVSLADKFFRAYNDGDLDALEQALSPNVDFAHHNRGITVQSREELIEGLRMGADTIVDKTLHDPSRVTASGNTVVRESKWSGTPQQDIPGFATAGELLELNLCSVLTFDDNGIIVEWKDYG